MQIAPSSPWAEAALHVLAHVDVGRVAASCHAPAWIALAAERMGPPGSRTLAEDAALLARAAGTHDALSRAQAIVWLFDGEAGARAASSRDLAELADADVASARALRMARDAGPAAELLRAATELELPLFVRTFGAAPGGDDALVEALSRVASAAPELARFEVGLARPLALRGRVFERTILVGAPGWAGASAEHVAWQAAHEATVAEVVSRDGPRAFEDVERAAIALLRARARSAGSGDAHARWLARLDLSALGPIPDVPDGA